MNSLPQNRVYARAEATHDEGLRQYMLGVYNYMTGGVALTGVVAYAMANLLPIDMLMTIKMISFVAMLGFAFMVLPKIMRMSVANAQLTFWGYAALMGSLFASIFAIYGGLDITRAFLITAGAFGGLSLYGYTTKKDLTGMGSFLIMGAMGIFLTMIVNMFMQSEAVHYAMCFIGVGVFSGLVAYETQAIRRSYYEVGGNAEMAAKVSIMGALNLYGSFLNIFIFILQLMGNRE